MYLGANLHSRDEEQAIVQLLLLVVGSAERDAQPVRATSERSRGAEERGAEEQRSRGAEEQSAAERGRAQQRSRAEEEQRTKEHRRAAEDQSAALEWGAGGQREQSGEMREQSGESRVEREKEGAAVQRAAVQRAAEQRAERIEQQRIAFSAERAAESSPRAVSVALCRCPSRYLSLLEGVTHQVIGAIMLEDSLYLLHAVWVLASHLASARRKYIMLYHSTRPSHAVSTCDATNNGREHGQ